MLLFIFHHYFLNILCWFILYSNFNNSIIWNPGRSKSVVYLLIFHYSSLFSFVFGDVSLWTCTCFNLWQFWWLLLSVLIQKWIFFLLFLSMLRALKTCNHFSPWLNQKSQAKHLYLVTCSRLSLLRVMAQTSSAFLPSFALCSGSITLVSIKELWLVSYFVIESVVFLETFF